MPEPAAAPVEGGEPLEDIQAIAPAASTAEGQGSTAPGAETGEPLETTQAEGDPAAEPGNHWQSVVGRQSRELGELRKQVERYEALLTEREQRQSPPSPTPAAPDPASVREEAIAPLWQEEFTDLYQLAQATGADVSDEQIVNQLRYQARKRAERTYDREKAQNERNLEQAHQIAQSQIAPIVLAQTADEQLQAVKVEGLTRQALLQEAAQMLHLERPEQLAGIPKEAQANILSTLAKARAYDAQQKAPAPEAKPARKPTPPPVPFTPQPAVQGGPKPSETAGKPADPALEAQREKLRRAYPTYRNNPALLEEALKEEE